MKHKKRPKFVMTGMMARYFVKLLIRVGIFVSIVVFYIMDKPLMCHVMTMDVYKGIRPIHILWLYFMSLMVIHIFPFEKIRLTMAKRKAEEKPYHPVEGYSELELLQFVQNQNVKAWTVMLVWLLTNCVIGGLYLFHFLDDADLLMCTVFFFLCDYICILFFCPFQKIIMKNRCCVNCRIYDWGHFMMFTPMLFIRNFFSWSLFFTSCVVLIHWEVVYAKHPERFWYGSNKNLQCVNCKDRTCQIKNRIMGKVE